MSACLISDLHLQENRPELTKAFKKFLVSHAADVDSLYILGDLFEAWIGDDYENDFIAEVKFELKKYSSLGKKIYLMHGNRDFMMSEDFCKKLGMKLIPDPSIISLYGRKVLLMHGDTLCTDDHAYQDFRKLVRSVSWQKEVLKKSLEERIMLAKELRQKSLKETGTKKEIIMQLLLIMVQQKIYHLIL